MARGYANPDQLVDTEWLADQLGAPDLRVFDTTVHLLPDPPRTYRIESGRDDYEKAHIPTAAFLDLADELSDPASSLRFTMPPPEQLERVLSAAGIGTDTRVVLYSTSHAMWATRMWWMLRASGFERAAVLDGGWYKWMSEGRGVCQRTCGYSSDSFKASPRPELWADRDEVLGAIGNPTVATLNALPRETHTGEAELSYGRKGHIAGSANVPYSSLMERKLRTFKAAPELRREFDRVGAFDKERVITYCGGCISATVDAFALTLLGHPGVAVYDGSLSEWAADPSLPLVTGAAPGG